MNCTEDAANQMASSGLIADNGDDPKLAANEVQFALVIARMIDTVQNSPADMRQAIYELARYKLQEQFTQADAKDIRYTQQALETAIRGVEEFCRKKVEIPGPVQQLGRDGVPSPPALAQPARFGAGTHVVPDIDRSMRRGSSLWGIASRTFILLILVGIGLIAVQQRERLVLLANISHAGRQPSVPAQPEPRAAASPELKATPKPNPLRPTDYGVYALGADSLSELQLLPGRPPDIRVAISAAIKEPSHTVLPNGHPRFLVFRRDLATNSADRADVRIIAKVGREFSAEAAGKKPDQRDETWVMRNVAFPFRAAPAPDSPDMYELHSEDPTLELPAGRYALVFKNQAFDFTVAGTPTDPRQCIERVVSTTGTFYTDCGRP